MHACNGQVERKCLARLQDLLSDAPPIPLNSVFSHTNIEYNIRISGISAATSTYLSPVFIVMKHCENPLMRRTNHARITRVK